MRSTTRSKGMQVPTATTTAGGENRQDARKRHLVEIILWIIGFILFVVSCVIMRFHPQPYPLGLATTQAVQNAGTPTWLLNILNFPSVVNDPIPSFTSLAISVFGMLFMGLIFWLRGKSPVRWIQSGLFLLATVMTSAGLNVLIDEVVGRPRPNPHTEPIHLHTPLVPFPTYPSGHTEHDVAFYGFLLYLSFTKPVREWRYRWALLPLQIYAVFDILFIGYSRIWEGDHWLGDVLGGYLEGALYLYIFIVLYRLVTDLLAKHYAKKRAERTQVAS